MDDLDLVRESQSLTEIITNMNSLMNDALGAGLMMVVFIVSFYRLSQVTGNLSAFTASTFSVTILGFILATFQLVPVSLPFLVGFLSVASLGYMYVEGRV